MHDPPKRQSGQKGNGDAMSIECLTMVWKDDYYTENDKTKLLVALAIADCADAAGCAFPGVEYLARKARCTTRSVQELCRRLEADGKLEIHIGKGRNGTNLYRIVRVKPLQGEKHSVSDKGVKRLRGAIFAGCNGVPVQPPVEAANETPVEFTQTVRNRQEASGIGRNRQALALVEFDRFWTCYPKKVGKEAARKAWLRAGVTFEQCERTLAVWKKSADWTKDGGQFIPHAATWLNQKRWQDEAPKNGVNGRRIESPDVSINAPGQNKPTIYDPLLEPDLLGAEAVRKQRSLDGIPLR